MPRESPSADSAAAPASAGDTIQAAIVAIMRWASRSDVRQALVGPAGRDLSSTDTWLLRAIVEDGPVRVTDLAEWQGVDKSTVTPQVRRLEDRALITRRPDPHDRRAVLLEASDLGRQILQATAAAGAAVFDDILRDWTDGDRDVLGALLGRFAQQLSHEPPRRSRQSTAS